MATEGSYGVVSAVWLQAVIGRQATAIAIPLATDLKIRLEVDLNVIGVPAFWLVAVLVMYVERRSVSGNGEWRGRSVELLRQVVLDMTVGKSDI